MAQKTILSNEEGGRLSGLLSHSLKARYGASIETLKRIEDDDDWSFVIKLHSLLEASMTALLAGNLDPRLSEIVKEMPLGDVKRGKLAWISALDLLSKELRAFVRLFSSIRNTNAHEIGDSDFTFEKWISRLDASEVRRYREVVVPIIGEKLLVAGKPRLTAERALENPRAIMFKCAISVLSSVQGTLARVERERDQSTPKESKTTHPQQ